VVGGEDRSLAGFETCGTAGLETCATFVKAGLRSGCIL